MRRSLASAALLVLGTAWALDPPEAGPPAPGAEAAAAQPAQVPAEGPAGDAATAAGDEAEEMPPPAGPPPRGPTPQRFDPSEEVRADFPVSFPVDI